MGANKFFFSQFRKVLSLVADYQFNNNLIDDANGYNLTGTDITYNNGNAVFNGVNSFANRNDTGGLFSFTDGVNDLPFKIETSIKFNAFTSVFAGIVAKRDGNVTSREWQFFYSNSSNAIRFTLFTDSINANYIQKGFVINPQLNTTYNIVVTYDGSKSINGLKIFVNGIEGTDVQEIGNYTGMSKTGSSLTLGKANFNNIYDFDGEIDYLKIYK